MMAKVTKGFLGATHSTTHGCDYNSPLKAEGPGTWWRLSDLMDEAELGPRSACL